MSWARTSGMLGGRGLAAGRVGRAAGRRAGASRRDGVLPVSRDPRPGLFSALPPRNARRPTALARGIAVSNSNRAVGQASHALSEPSWCRSRAHVNHGSVGAGVRAAQVQQRARGDHCDLRAASEWLAQPPSSGSRSAKLPATDVAWSRMAEQDGRVVPASRSAHEASGKPAGGAGERQRQQEATGAPLPIRRAAAGNDAHASRVRKPLQASALVSSAQRCPAAHRTLCCMRDCRQPTPATPRKPDMLLC